MWSVLCLCMVNGHAEVKFKEAFTIISSQHCKDLPSVEFFPPVRSYEECRASVTAIHPLKLSTRLPCDSEQKCLKHLHETSKNFRPFSSGVAAESQHGIFDPSQLLLDISVWQQDPFSHIRSFYGPPQPSGGDRKVQWGSQNAFTVKGQLTTFPFQQQLQPLLFTSIQGKSQGISCNKR